jgi:hypothetical protein
LWHAGYINNNCKARKEREEFRKIFLANLVSFAVQNHMMNSPRFLLSFGVLLMFLGIFLPFLMVVHVLESTFFLNFFAWGASVVGLSLGTIGFALWSRGGIKKE